VGVLKPDRAVGVLRPDLRSGCRCAKAQPGCGCAKAQLKVGLWFSSGLAVVCAGVQSVVSAGVQRPY
jgi:hypothetical protein